MLCALPLLFLGFPCLHRSQCSLCGPQLLALYLFTRCFSMFLVGQWVKLNGKRRFKSQFSKFLWYISLSFLFGVIFLLICILWFIIRFYPQFRKQFFQFTIRQHSNLMHNSLWKDSLIIMWKSMLFIASCSLLKLEFVSLNDEMDFYFLFLFIDNVITLNSRTKHVPFLYCWFQG